MMAMRAVVFDWGDTLMRDLGFPGPMVNWPRVEAMKGAAEALEAISEEMICCVASNAGDSDAELMGQALERVGMRRFFRYLWTSRELGAAKPERAFFEAILERLGLPAGACVYVGNDLEKDIVPARAVGMRTVWVAAGGREAAVAADAVLGAMGELVGAVDGMRTGFAEKEQNSQD
jgi:HAD superfamily hydrolase (TIGR01509 family)